MAEDSFARLAAVLAPGPARATPLHTQKRRKIRREPDRSRDHAIYAAPHRPPARSVPIFEREKEIDTVKRLALARPAAVRSGPPVAAIAAALVAAAISFGIAAFAGFGW